MKHRVKIPRIFKNHYTTTNRMAKDPAFLFYSSDFMMGTALLSETEVGQYIRIMCHMHQSGHLSLEDMKNICPNISSKVVAKFKVDEQGNYYQERLEQEIIKRKNYSESRRNNRKKVKPASYDTTHVPDLSAHMSGHMENENENPLLSNKGVGNTGEKPSFSHAPTLASVLEYFMMNGWTEKQAKKFYNYHDGIGWRKGMSPIYNWRSFALSWMSDNPDEAKSGIVKFRGPTGEGTMAIEDWTKNHEGNPDSSLRRIG